MKAKYEVPVTLRGLLRGGFAYGPPNYGMHPETDSFQTPIFLTLDEPIDAEPSPDQGEGPWAGAHRGVTEVQIAPTDHKERPRKYPDFEPYLGAVVEITGRLFPAHTGHHHRSVLLECAPGNIRKLAPFPFDDVAGAKILARGSGIIVDGTGHILTAEHVVQGMAYSVRRGLERAEAHVVGIHPKLDIAILLSKLSRVAPVAARFVLSPTLGETVYACGFPLRPYLAHSMSITSGIVSSGYDARGHFSFTAPIQKGNSGGPVYDEYGNLLGLVSSRAKSKELLRLGGAAVPDDGVQDGLQLLNSAVSISAAGNFLRDKSVGIDDCLYVHSLPTEEVSPLRGTEIARRALMNCVEVESWAVCP